MAEQEIVAVVAAPPAALHRFLGDLTNEPTWRRDVIGAELLAGEPGEAGARYRTTAEAADVGMIIPLDVVVTESRPPDALRATMTFDVTTVDLEYRLSPVDGGTEVAATLRVDAPGPLARISLKPFVAALERDLEDLVGLVADGSLDLG